MYTSVYICAYLSDAPILGLHALFLYSSYTLNKTRKIGSDYLLIRLLSLTLFGTGFVVFRRKDEDFVKLGKCVFVYGSHFAAH